MLHTLVRVDGPLVLPVLIGIANTGCIIQDVAPNK